MRLKTKNKRKKNIPSVLFIVKTDTLDWVGQKNLIEYLRNNTPRLWSEWCFGRVDRRVLNTRADVSFYFHHDQWPVVLHSRILEHLPANSCSFDDLHDGNISIAPLDPIYYDDKTAYYCITFFMSIFLYFFPILILWFCNKSLHSGQNGSG